MEDLNLDRALIDRYDIAGPRYTSYPTAVHFTENFGAEDYARAVQSSNDDPIPAPLSLYFHIPFCHQQCYYCGCTRVITRHHEKASAYMARVFRELELQAALFDRDRRVTQLHLGGGTPTYLTPGELTELLDVAGAYFRFAPKHEREFSIEIDPRSIAPDELAHLAEIGFSRISLGVQDFDPDVQAAINRVQPEALTRDLLTAGRAAGIESINFDLVYGLPRQTAAGFGSTLDRVIDMRPNRIAVYSYAHMPQLFRAQRLIRSEDLPTPEAKLNLLLQAIRRLREAGYVYIGLDHFALPDDPMAIALREGTLQRNFQGYSTGAETDLVGFGMSAISSLNGVYAQNLKGLRNYEKALDEGRLAIHKGLALTTDDRLRRDIIQKLMCSGEVRMAELEQRYSLDFERYFAAELTRLKPFVQDGLVECANRRIRVLPAGRLFLRPVSMVFDSYLPHANHDSQTRFSRVI